MQERNKTVVGTYDTRDEALDVVHKLKDAGYQKENIILYANEDVTQTQSDYEAVNIEADTTPTRETRETNKDDQSLWEQIKDAFSSDTYDHDVRKRNEAYNQEDDLLYPYRDDIKNGKVVIVLDGYNGEDLNRYNAARNVGDSDKEFDHGTPETTTVTTTEDSARDSDLDDDRVDREHDKLNTADLKRTDNTDTTNKNIQLKEEELDVDTNEVKTGEVNVHKEVVKDTETVEVPVEREEVVVERKPVDNTDRTATDDIRTEDSINIPVKEEQIEVNKKPVVKEEVDVRKETHKDTKKVSEEVRHEELDVDTDGDVRVDDDTTNMNTSDTTKKKNNLDNYKGVRDTEPDTKVNPSGGKRDVTKTDHNTSGDINDPLTDGRDFSREDDDMDAYKK